MTTIARTEAVQPSARQIRRNQTAGELTRNTIITSLGLGAIGGFIGFMVGGSDKAILGAKIGVTIGVSSSALKIFSAVKTHL